MIRAPDVFMYTAPFNIVETFFIAPLELVRHLSPTLLFDESFTQVISEPINLREGASLRVPRS